MTDDGSAIRSAAEAGADSVIPRYASAPAVYWLTDLTLAHARLETPNNGVREKIDIAVDRRLIAQVRIKSPIVPNLASSP
jgi:hypothetical protein